MIRSDAKPWPPHRYLRKLHRWLLTLRQSLVRDIEITDGSSAYRFRCETVPKFNRCLKLFSKGTRGVHVDHDRGETRPGGL